MAARLLHPLTRRRFVWPVTLAQTGVERRGLAREVDKVVLRPLRARDAVSWRELRLCEAERLNAWDASLPVGSQEPQVSFAQYVRHLRRQARLGEAMPFVVEVDGFFAGQLAVEPIVWGAVRSATLGYWIGQHWAGRGVMTLCVAMALDHLLGEQVRLHRVEVNIRPENAASLAVVAKLGLRDEGLRQRYMHVAGRWADHRSFAVTAEERGTGYVRRLERRAAQTQP